MLNNVPKDRKEIHEGMIWVEKTSERKPQDCGTRALLSSELSKGTTYLLLFELSLIWWLKQTKKKERQREKKRERAEKEEAIE